MMKRIVFICAFLPAFFIAGAQPRIVSLNGTISEMLCGLGLGDQIVGVDVTSNYPAFLQKKPKVGHNSNLSAEGILALQPTLVIGLEGQFSARLDEQLSSAGVKTARLQQDYSVEGTRRLLKEVASLSGTENKVAGLLAQFDEQIAQLRITPLREKVLFIYARGSGTMLVSGTGTSLDRIITLAGARNAVTEFNNFKPLSAESLVAMNPDVILLFSSGLQSLGGAEGLLKMPGVAQTTAGRNKNIIAMDGELVSSFGLRLPQAIRELHDRIQKKEMAVTKN
jgi:iron complex transport system substrate-binding protein